MAIGKCSVKVVKADWAVLAQVDVSLSLVWTHIREERPGQRHEVCEFVTSHGISMSFACFVITGSGVPCAFLSHASKFDCDMRVRGFGAVF